ncbi:Chemotaxis protein CheY [Alphaproteobacteria bacterium SO-S41]|nr:Chemotaxis protein CheY [Alphaproteobacteria bacterium SO-S41]
MTTCLVIDDSRVIRKVARRLLEDMGFAVEEAEDGAAALEACRTAMPDAILVDSAMPNMDGVTFMKALRREAIGALPAIIYCTTENDEPHVVSARAAGAARVLMKPFDKETLEASLTGVGVVPH